jgi:hypothetical protein
MGGKDDLGLVVEIDPGDTMGQAKKLYGDCEMGEVLALRDHGWTVEPNFHVAHMTLNLLWTHTTIPIEDYWKFWVAHPKWLRQVPRAKFEETFALFLAHGLATELDRSAYESNLIGTKRQAYNLCPGLTLRWRKRLDDAAVLDQRGQLEDVTRSAIERASKALKLKLPWLPVQLTARRN